jgi:hypothetical protein
LINSTELDLPHLAKEVYPRKDAIPSHLEKEQIVSQKGLPESLEKAIGTDQN